MHFPFYISYFIGKCLEHILRIPKLQLHYHILVFIIFQKQMLINLVIFSLIVFHEGTHYINN
jgi:hypothetical protein